MNIIDVKGKTSFKAVSELHNVISTFEPGEFGVLSNDSLVLRNVEKILKKKGIEFKTEKKNQNEFFTTFFTTKEHSKELSPENKEKVEPIEEFTPTVTTGNQNSSLDILIFINLSITKGPNITLNKLHLRSVLNEIAISDKLVKGIIISNESVKILDEKNEFFPILKRVSHKNIQIIADEQSVAFYAVNISKTLKISLLPTSSILKTLCKQNIKIITI